MRRRRSEKKSLCEKKYNDDEARTSTEKLFVGEFSAVIFFSLLILIRSLLGLIFFRYVGNELFCELGRFDMLEWAISEHFVFVVVEQLFFFSLSHSLNSSEIVLPFFLLLFGIGWNVGENVGANGKGWNRINFTQFTNFLSFHYYYSLRGVREERERGKIRRKIIMRIWE